MTDSQVNFTTKTKGEMHPMTTRMILKGVFWQLLDGCSLREVVYRRSRHNDARLCKLMNSLKEGHMHYIRLDLGYTSDPSKHRTYEVEAVFISDDPYKKTYSFNGSSVTVEMNEPHFVITFKDIDASSRASTVARTVLGTLAYSVRSFL